MKTRFIKLKDFMNLVQNKTTKQYSFNIKKKQLKGFGLSPKAVLNFKVPLEDMKKRKRSPQWQ